MPEGYRRQRLEAIVALLIWACAGVWVITASYTLSAERPIRLIGGIPHWVVWGILVPWVTAFVVHTWYSLFFVGSGRED
ncbi:MAG: hypothetical protein H6509_02125 [Bryobacterales bacterium]|nr:hypothetical protein [Bryobacterales bacterium]